MAKLPRPERPLPSLRPSDVTTVGRGAALWRVYLAGGSFPIAWNQFRHFGPLASARFDHQTPPPHADATRGICYLADRPQVCFAESFQDQRVIDRTRHVPCLAQFSASADTTCLDLSGAWPTRAGASQAISSGRRDTARLWSQAIHEEYPDVDGILYPSSMFGGGSCLALYERGVGLFPERPHLNRPLVDPGLDAVLRQVATQLGYVIVTGAP